MAQRVINYVVYSDDLTGEEYNEGGGETLTYGLDGVTYEVDLTSENAKALREALSPFIPVSRKTVDARGRLLAPAGGNVSGSRRTSAEMQKIREWGRANGYEVPDPGKGRVPWGMTKAYDRAMAAKGEQA
jgi:hypothetical protein